MRNMTIAVVVLAGLLPVDAAVPGLWKSEVAPAQLRCEYIENPLGIDTQKPRLSWQIESPLRGDVQQSAQIIVASSKALIDANSGDMWSATLNSSQSVNVEYAGAPLSSARQYYWKVKVTTKKGVSGWSKTALFATGLLSASDWTGASWIGMASAGDHDCPWVRKSVALDAVPETALACIGSIGYHELYVNGEKVGDAVLSPNQSDMQKRILYVTYDIQRYLKKGNNVIALWLAPGWSLFVGVNPRMDFQLAKKPLCIGKVVFSKRNPLVTDSTWKCAQSSTVHLGGWSNSNFGGDRIDARKHIPGWNTAEFSDNSWENATAYTVNRILSPDLAPPNRRCDIIEPLSITKIGTNKYKVVMSKLYTGWIEVALRNGTAGSNVTITTSSFDGRECEHNQRDEYIFDTSGQGIFCNRFSYHLIHYIVISGISCAPELSDIKGYRIGNDFKRSGSFDCSNGLLKKIYDSNLNTILNLTTGGVTCDCPHRERLGYGEVVQGCMETMFNNYEMGAFYTKALQDWSDVQRADGSIPNTAPTHDGGGGPAWQGSLVTVSWEMFCTYGDERILHSVYPAMKQWIAFLDTKDDDNSLLGPYKVLNGWWIGDWLTPHGSEYSADTTILFNNCYYLFVMRIMTRIAHVLGNTADETAYGAKAGAISNALNARFYNAAGSFYLDTLQTHLLMPLMAGAVPPASINKVMANLEKAIVVDKKGHLDVGDPGIYYLTKYLTETDRSDLVFTYANQTTYPSYGYFISKGLDTWPEHWRGDQGSSIMHSCYPGIGAWFQEGLGGIRFDPAAPGFKHVILKPAVVGDVTWVKASVPSVYGIITSDWSVGADGFDYSVKIPVNSHATVYLPTPGSGGCSVYEGSTQLWKNGVVKKSVPGVKLNRVDGGLTVWDVGSGDYHFKVRKK